jgi:NAD(P)-dependent dehydrogenase (short-subunit alcohol dehydrogenase family)
MSVSSAPESPTCSARLAGHVVVVTGSTGLGAGTEVARILAAEGAEVVVTGRSEERGRRIVDEISAFGGSSICVPGDLSKEDDCRRIIEEGVAHYGRLTALVHSAVATVGPLHLAASPGGGDGPIADVTDEAWEQQLAINLTSFLWLCRHGIPHLKAAGGGSIVPIGSRVGERGTPNTAAYTATKGALHALARSIAVDYATMGIRCNTVAVGYIVDKEREGVLSPETRAWVEGMHLTRPPTVTDVARAVAYLISDDAASITGHTLMLDGGSSISRARVVG